MCVHVVSEQVPSRANFEGEISLREVLSGTQGEGEGRSIVFWANI